MAAAEDFNFGGLQYQESDKQTTVGWTENNDIKDYDANSVFNTITNLKRVWENLLVVLFTDNEDTTGLTSIVELFKGDPSVWLGIIINPKTFEHRRTFDFEQKGINQTIASFDNPAGAKLAISEILTGIEFPPIWLSVLRKAARWQFKR
jgi:hypothetical protein